MAFLRKNIRLPSLNYLGCRRFFITLCCEHRRKFFVEWRRAERLVELLRATAIQHQMAVYAYCVMPDHMHMLVIGLDPSSNCRNFVMDLKRRSTEDFQLQNSNPLWQKKFYDHILRRKDATGRVAAYIWMNPVRKGLCALPEDYPFSGSFVSDWQATRDLANPWVPEWKQK